jgi:hypothetical protein
MTTFAKAPGPMRERRQWRGPIRMIYAKLCGPMRGTHRVRGPMRMTCGKVRESTKETSPVLVSTTFSQERHETQKTIFFSSRNCDSTAFVDSDLNNTVHTFFTLILLPFPLLYVLSCFLSYIIKYSPLRVFFFSVFFVQFSEFS